MKKNLVFISSLIILVSLSYGGQDYYSFSYARLSYVKGDVFIQRVEDLGYEEGVVNYALIEGEKIGTREGLAEIHFGRRNYLRIDGYTQLDLVDLPERGDDRIQIHLLSGNIYLRVNYLEREKDFEIHTPDASFYILDSGLYRVDVKEGRETEFTVLEGAAEAAGEEGSALVESQEALMASDGFFREEPRFAGISYEDSFARWNSSRDALYASYRGKRYLPDELYEYEHELAENGRWVYERPYGYVWVPYVYRSSWRPYYYGRWVWYPIIGWNWVSYDPWGWCVYHYGRWHWRLGLGWYWIPTRHWGPAWVHWYHGYDYYGWCPLSYYGYPAVIINNRFYGRYYQRHYPVHSRALTVIHKRQLQARHISKVALSSGEVSRLGKISLTAAKIKARPVVDSTSLKNSKAAKVLARSEVRSVTKGYSSSRSSSVSKLKTTKIKVQPTKSSARSPSSVSESRSKLSKIRTYPSKKASSSGTLSKNRISPTPTRTYSSSSAKKSTKIYSSRSSITSSRKSSRSSIGTSKARSSKTPSRSSVKSYTSSRSKTSVKSRSSAPKSYSLPSQSRTNVSSRSSRSSSEKASKVRSSKSPSRISSKSYTPSRSKSSVSSRTSSSKSRTTVKSRASSPKKSSAASRNKSSSSSRASRSSSSRASSGKKVKK
jgi:hypothetical protein